MIPKETIDKIFEAAHIEEVIGDFLPLKKRGVNMIGLCPFHNEKTPSFTVSPSKGIYKCFGCGESGTAVNFVMKHENMTYPEALKYLAAKYGIEVEEKEMTDEEKVKEKERESLMGVTAFAQAHFADTLLKSDEGKAIGLKYFNERGFNDYIIEKFGLGYAADSWDDLQKAAKAKGYTEDVLIKTGLIVKTEEGKTYDRFRGRVIFPIYNISGRPIGFGGRILDSSKSKAKYVNSPESEIYHKSNVLYGLNLARTPIMKAENCYLVEGYTDVISLHMAGIENVVASSGTSLTTGQIKLLKRFTNKITILYDGDTAGIKASFRGIDMIIEEGLNVKIVLFPEGEDPDSFARSHSAEEVEKFVTEQAKDFILFKSDMLKGEAGNDPAARSEMIKDIVRSIALIPENIDRQLYTREAAVILEIDEEILVNEIAKYRRKKYYKDKKDYSPPEEEPAKKAPQILLKDNTLNLEKEITRVLLNYGNFEFIPKLSGMPLLAGDTEEKVKVSDFIISTLLDDDIVLKESAEISQIFQEFVEAYEQDKVPSQQFFVKYEDEKVNKLAIDLITDPYNLHEWSKIGINVADETTDKVLARLVVASVYAYKQKIVNNRIVELTEQLKEEGQDEEKVFKLQKTIAALTSTRNKILKEMGRVVLPG